MTAKTHFTTEPNTVACGRPAKRSSENVHRVTCLNCKAQPEYAAAVTEAGLKAAEAFANQTPAPVRNPWDNSEIACRKCGHNLFRSNGRSLDYYRWVCAGCGESTQTMTETGMSA
jgi:Zn finger protein HypA/HybF involved in hydrogenase expression